MGGVRKGEEAEMRRRGDEMDERLGRRGEGGEMRDEG